MKFLSFLLTSALLVFATQAFAGFDGYNGSQQLGVFNTIKCSTGLTCTRNGAVFSVVSSPSITGGSFTLTAPTSTAATFDIQANNNASNGDDWRISSAVSEGGLLFQNNTSGSMVTKFSIDTSGDIAAPGNAAITGNETVGGTLGVTGVTTLTGHLIPTGGIGSGTSTLTRFAAWFPSAVTDATSTTPSVTTLYLTQVHVAHNFTATGINVLNAATVGTNKYIVALYTETGSLVANSATAGVLTAGASGYQQVAFTSTAAVTGPATYWIGLFVNGTTDRFYAIPAQGSVMGLAGTITGQTFGTVPATITPPTTFTAAAGAVVGTY